MSVARATGAAADRRQVLALAFIALAVWAVAAIAGVHPASAYSAGAKRDQLAALRVSVRWMAVYQPRSWVAVERPGVCVTRSGGIRRCPIAIVIKARVGSMLVDHRCAAEAVLRPRGAGAPTRTSARCTPVPTDPASPGCHDGGVGDSACATVGTRE